MSASPRNRTTPARIVAALLVLFVATALATALAAGVGVEHVDFARAFVAGSTDSAILFGSRLPRVVLGLVVGGALAGSGVTFQVLLGNPLADPYVLGVSAGAAIVVTLAGAFGLAESAFSPALAFVGALGAMALVYAVGRVRGRFSPAIALLAGVVFNAFAGGIVVFIIMISRPERAADVLGWLIGSLGSPAWSEWPRLLAIVIWTGAGVIVLCAMAPRMNALAFGDEAAWAVGIDVTRTRSVLFIAGSLLTGAAVAAAGPIGFVGIVVPHALRLVLGPDHRLLVPASVLGGAMFLVLSDLAARLLFLGLGNEPGVGVVTALVGAPFFLALLVRRRGERLLGLLALAALCQGACHRPAPPADLVEVTDEVGRRVKVPRVARRIASLAPNTTELVCALGACDRLVGVDTFSDFPPEVKARQVLGTNLEPNIERLLALKPDLVLVATTANREESVQRLASLGLSVYTTRTTGLESLYATFRGVGGLLGKSAEAEALVSRTRARLGAVRAAHAGRPRPKALVVVWHDPLVTVGPASLPNELLELAGGDNVCADADAAFPRYPIERVLARGPEVIVVGTHAQRAAVEHWARWPTLPAVKAGRVLAIDGDLLFRPGPRVAEGAEALGRALFAGGAP